MPTSRLVADPGVCTPASSQSALSVEKQHNRRVLARSVLEVLSALERVSCRAWVAGGWGVDALVGEQTREHRDLDLAIDCECEAAALAALARLGYAIETEWRPVRVELAAPGSRWVDLHPVRFDAHGDGRQAGLDGGHFEYPRGSFMSGVIDGHEVGCLSAELQRRFHTGYELRDVDRHDLALLDRLAAG
jgi:lincosamide nucleotidyltransferase A/C/D/E